jgi:hypothetical protein
MGAMWCPSHLLTLAHACIDHLVQHGSKAVNPDPYNNSSVQGNVSPYTRQVEKSYSVDSTVRQVPVFNTPHGKLPFGVD